MAAHRGRQGAHSLPSTPYHKGTELRKATKRFKNARKEGSPPSFEPDKAGVGWVRGPDGRRWDRASTRLPPPPSGTAPPARRPIGAEPVARRGRGPASSPPAPF